MKDYYRILDLPKDASRDQIRDRYRQLVRIFHPDRYPKSEDKAYAEQKLQEINEAYESLYGGGSRRQRPSSSLRLSSDKRLPRPVVYPEKIDFGSVAHGERAVAQLKIDNVGGYAQSLSFHTEDGAGWFTITKGERIDPTKPLPMLLDIEARTASLTTGQAVENWLDIDVNGVRARATLRMNVVDHVPAASGPGRLVSLIMAIVILLVVVYAGWAMLGGASSDNPTSIQVTQPAETAPGQNGGFMVAEIETSERETNAVTTPIDTSEASPQNRQVPENSESHSALLRPVNSIPTATVGPPAKMDLNTDPNVDGPSNRQVGIAGVVSNAPEVATTINGQEIEGDIASKDRASLVSRAVASLASERTVASRGSTEVAAGTSLSLTSQSPKPTPIETFTPSPTLLVTPTAIVIPATASPTPTKRPVTITVPRTYQINVRASTTTESEALALLDKGATFPAIARTIDNAWTKIILPDGRTGWVYTTSMVVNLEQIGTLPVAAE